MSGDYVLLREIRDNIKNMKIQMNYLVLLNIQMDYSIKLKEYELGILNEEEYKKEKEIYQSEHERFFKYISAEYDKT